MKREKLKFLGYRNVATGRKILGHLNPRDLPEADAWFTSVIDCKDDSYPDQHTSEVCLFNGSHHHLSPTWPILGFFDRKVAEQWEEKLRVFARTLDPENSFDHFDKEVNGDKRLGAWLTEQGFERFNHIWWVLKK